VVKAQSAIRNYHIKAADGGWGCVKQRQKENRTTFKKKPPAGARLSTPAKKPHPTVIYRAEAGETSIHPYALLLISAVCNQRKQKRALRVLDLPLAQCFIDGEPAKERAMRLQVCIRLFHVC
jgi:hypothetical protein